MILVVGATGVLGGVIARKLLAQGHEVRALVRPGSPREELEREGATIVPGDLKEPATVAAACRGVDVVITTANTAGRGGADTVETVDLRGTRTLIDAAREAGVRQFIYTSAHGADAESPMPFIRAKGLSERALQDGDMPYTILSPVAFMDVWVGVVVGVQLQHGDTVHVSGTGDEPMNLVASDDVAELAVRAVGHDAALNRMLPLSAEHVSFRHIVATVGRALGRDLRMEPHPIGQPLPGLPEIVPRMWAAGITGGQQRVDSGAVARRFGLALTPLDAFVQRTFAVGS